MTDSPELWDRLTGAPASLPRPPFLLSRYLIPPGVHGFAIGDVTVPPGSYLAAGTGRWTLRRGTRRWPGDFGAAPVPAPVARERIAAIGRRAAELVRAGAPPGEWTAISPLVTQMEERLRRYPLENHLRAELRYLQAVSREPHARLRTDYVVVPVSKARRITWRTTTYLAVHSETWAARTLHGVEPAKLLVPAQAADHDLYENRVVATLLDRLWGYVQARLMDLDQIDAALAQGTDIVRQAEKRADWRERQRLYGFIAELLNTDGLTDLIERRRAELTELRNSLAPLLASPLRAGVKGPYTGPWRLRPTNLFDHDLNYKHCRRLWDIEVAARQAADGPADPIGTQAAWCGDFARYALVLILHALDQLGLVRTTQPSLEPGRPGPAYSYRTRVVRLDWNHDDTYSLMLDDQQALRLVPVAHALTARAGATELNRHLNELQHAHLGKTAILYPSERRERQDLALDCYLAVHNAYPRQGAAAMVPVSPVDLGSVGRVARTLRAALDEPIMLGYPARVETRVTQASGLAQRFTWLNWHDDHLSVIAPLPARETSQLGAAVSELRIRADRARRRSDNQDELNELHKNLLEAAHQLAALSWCPFCLREVPDPAAAFRARDDETYRVQCPSCSTTWETRRCTSCNRNYPILAVSATAGKPGGPGDMLDEQFSQEMRAVPCWLNSRSYMCFFCGYCPEKSSDNCGSCNRGLNAKGRVHQLAQHTIGLLSAGGPGLRLAR